MSDEKINALALQVVKLQGQLLAVQAATRALILRQPDPQSAAAFVSEELSRWMAIGLHKDVSDATLDGFEHAMSVVLPTDADIERTR